MPACLNTDHWQLMKSRHVFGPPLLSFHSSPVTPHSCSISTDPYCSSALWMNISLHISHTRKTINHKLDFFNISFVFLDSNENKWRHWLPIYFIGRKYNCNLTCLILFNKVPTLDLQHRSHIQPMTRC